MTFPTPGTGAGAPAPTFPPSPRPGIQGPGIQGPDARESDVRGTGARGPGTPGPGTPPRPTLPPTGATSAWRSRLYGILGLLLFGACFALSVTHVAPSLVTDWQVRGAAEIVEPSSVRGGRCSVKLFVHLCDAELSASTKRSAVTRSVHYVFVDTAAGDYSVSVMADPERPALLTTDLGLDRLVNRTVTLLAVWALLLALMSGSVLAMRRAGR